MTKYPFNYMIVVLNRLNLNEFLKGGSMSYPKFDEKELVVTGEIPGFFPRMPSTPLYDFPVSRKEAYIATMRKKPIWQLTTVEVANIIPSLVPDNVARAFVFETNPLKREDFGGTDMFGIEWVYVDVAGGSMVKPGNPFLKDANEWYDKLVWPDIDSWDWEGSAEINKDYLDRSAYVQTTILNGFFERLISFMDFEGAIMAMIDEDQQKAVNDLFYRLTDLYISIIDKFIEHYDIDGVSFHDDWGAQKDTFFSPQIAMEMIVPHMKRLTDHIHSKGLYADLHSCGHLEKQVESIIAAGWDSWSPMPMNDISMLYEKYGDKIIFGTIPELFDPETTSEEDQRKAAQNFVQQYCQPGKPCTISFYGMGALTPAFREELYRQSRIRFAE